MLTRADHPCRGCGKRSSGIWARCWNPARCAGRRSARNACTAWLRFDRWLTRLPSMTPATFSATRRPRPGRPPRSGGGTPTRPAAARQQPPAPAKVVTPRLINDDLRAVAELFAFVAASPAEARRVLGPSPWDGVTEAHAASWFRQVTRIPHQPALHRPATTSMTTPSGRSSPRCPCSACRAASRCGSPAATASRSSPAAWTTRRQCG